MRGRHNRPSEGIARNKTGCTIAEKSITRNSYRCASCRTPFNNTLWGLICWCGLPGSAQVRSENTRNLSHTKLIYQDSISEKHVDCDSTAMRRRSYLRSPCRSALPFLTPSPSPDLSTFQNKTGIPSGNGLYTLDTSQVHPTHTSVEQPPKREYRGSHVPV